MFCPGRQLKALTSLEVEVDAFCEGAVHTRQLRDIAVSCPRLQHITLLGCLHPAASVRPLARLQALTRLRLSHVGGGAGPELACLTTLSSLDILAPHWFGVDGVQQLSALACLTHLEMEHQHNPDNWRALICVRNKVGADATHAWRVQPGAQHVRPSGALSNASVPLPTPWWLFTLQRLVADTCPVQAPAGQPSDVPAQIAAGIAVQQDVGYIIDSDFTDSDLGYDTE
jgi:hypothetical protein